MCCKVQVAWLSSACRLYTVDEMGAANAVTDDARVWESVVGL